MDWHRVAEFVELRRGQLGYRRQEEAALAAHVGVQTWRDIEGARKDGYTPVILGAVAGALRWPADMLPRLARGENPPDDDPDTDRRLTAVEVAVTEIRRALGELRTFAQAAAAPQEEST